MKQTIETSWKGNMAFASDIDGHIVVTDAPESVGGNNSGPSPKKLMMASLAGCTGIDVSMILGKMRVDIDDLKIKIDAELTDDEPSLYSKMHITYIFKGKDLVYDKLKKAVELSQEKYCGVSMMYGKAMDLSWEIVVE